MAILDFGKIPNAMKDFGNLYGNRDMLVPVADAVQTIDHNMGSTVTSIINYQIIMGGPNDFLWGSHTWDDAIHTVV